MVQKSPIASVSFGQAREFVLKHADSRGKLAKRKINPIKIELHHGCLMMMNYPTNVYWYHSLPPRKKASGTRINLTFREFVEKI
jgi:alkylated DNA repair dioxygenase AlkB